MSGLASKAWSALRPTYSVATALNRQLCTTAAVERRHKDFIGNRQAKLTLQVIKMFCKLFSVSREFHTCLPA